MYARHKGATPKKCFKRFLACIYLCLTNITPGIVEDPICSFTGSANVRGAPLQVFVAAQWIRGETFIQSMLLLLTESSARSHSHACIPRWLPGHGDCRCVKHISQSETMGCWKQATVQPSTPTLPISIPLPGSWGQKMIYMRHCVKSLDILFYLDSVCECFDGIFVLVHGRK